MSSTKYLLKFCYRAVLAGFGNALHGYQLVKRREGEGTGVGGGETVGGYRKGLLKGSDLL